MFNFLKKFRFLKPYKVKVCMNQEHAVKIFNLKNQRGIKVIIRYQDGTWIAKYR